MYGNGLLVKKQVVNPQAQVLPGVNGQPFLAVQYHQAHTHQLLACLGQDHGHQQMA